MLVIQVISSMGILDLAMCVCLCVCKLPRQLKLVASGQTFQARLLHKTEELQGSPDNENPSGGRYSD